MESPFRFWYLSVCGSLIDHKKTIGNCLYQCYSFVYIQIWNVYVLFVDEPWLDHQISIRLGLSPGLIFVCLILLKLFCLLLIEKIFPSFVFRGFSPLSLTHRLSQVFLGMIVFNIKIWIICPRFVRMLKISRGV